MTLDAFLIIYDKFWALLLKIFNILSKYSENVISAPSYDYLLS